MPPADLVAYARARKVDLASFIECKGLIDFRSYVDTQTHRLAADAIYPPALYVHQRLFFEASEQHQETTDALRRVREWLDTPHGRFILLLGDFGTGKTFLLHELAR